MIPDLLKKSSILKFQTPVILIHTSQLINDSKMTTQIKMNFYIVYIINANLIKSLLINATPSRKVNTLENVHGR